MNSDTPVLYPHEQIQTRTHLPVRFHPYVAADHYIPEHWHNSVEVIYVGSGRMDVSIREDTIRLTPGRLVMINSGEIHATHCYGATHVTLLQIPYPFLKQNIPEYGSCLLQAPEPESLCYQKLANLLRRLTRLDALHEKKEVPETEFALSFLSLLYELLFHMARHCLLPFSPLPHTKDETAQERLRTIILYVRDHYKEILTLRDAAGLVSLTPEYFCRFFKKYMGLTFLEYVNSVRLSYIYEDLITDGDNITVLLNRHGFTNYKLFMKLFKQTYGCTPSQKRKMINTGKTGGANCVSRSSPP